MSVYFITGKLGNGKTLSGVSRIKEHLYKGLPVATNLDIDLVKLAGKDSKTVRLYRLKDKPNLYDLESLGDAYSNPFQKYDESKFGALVLDECATWFNARDWNDPERQALINKLVHIRKLHWNVYFIIQDVSVMDKQAIKLLCEHTVRMVRLDNVSIPLISPAIRFLTGQRLKLPQRFIGTVRLGANPMGMKLDTWYSDKSDFNLYDTNQIFDADYDREIYCQLPPYYTHGRYRIIMNKENIMRLTKIYFKRFSKAVLLVGGLLFGFLLTATAGYKYINQEMDSLKTDLNISDKKKEEKTDKKTPVNNTEKTAESIIDKPIEKTKLELELETAVDKIDELFIKYDPFIQYRIVIKNNVSGRIDFYNNNRRVNSMTFIQLTMQGWNLKYINSNLKVSKDTKNYYLSYKL